MNAIFIGADPQRLARGTMLLLPSHGTDAVRAIRSGATCRTLGTKNYLRTFNLLYKVVR